MIAQRPGMRQFITESQGIQGYEVLIGDTGISQMEELVILDPGMSQSYTFVPVIGGSKNSGLMMVLGVALIAATGGFAAFGIMAGGSTGAVAGAGMVGAQATAAQALTLGIAEGTALTLANAAALSGAAPGAILAVQGASYLGMGLLLGGASMMLAPDVPSGDNAEQAENYLFSGPINTVKQGQPIPLVYGRMVTGSKTIMASLFTTSSRAKINKQRKLVGIGGFREDGSVWGDSAPAGRKGWDGVDNVPPGFYRE